MVQIIELLENRSVAKLLVFFLRQPTLQIHQQELRKKVKLAKATLIKWLNFLVKNEVLKLLKFGRAKVYFLNRESAIVKPLKLLDNLLLLSDVKKLAAKHEVKAYLYGSAARGEDTEDSDIDTLIIGKIKKEQIIQEINNISNSIKRRIKVEIFSQQEWSQMAKKDPAFYERAEKDKIEL